MTGTPHSSLIGGTPSVRSVVLAQALRMSLRPLADRSAVGGARLSGLRCGTEMLWEDARALAAALAAAGVPHRLQVWRGQVHSFHLMSTLAPEPRRALDDAGRFVRDCLSATAVGTVDRAG